MFCHLLELEILISSCAAMILMLYFNWLQQDFLLANFVFPLQFHGIHGTPGIRWALWKGTNPTQTLFVICNKYFPIRIAFILILSFTNLFITMDRPLEDGLKYAKVWPSQLYRGRPWSAYHSNPDLVFQLGSELAYRWY